MARHLPIVNQKTAPPPGSVPAPEADEERPPWHWAAIGAALIFVLWLPLAMLGGAISRGLVASIVPSQGDVDAFVASSGVAIRLALRVSLVAPHVVMFLLASMSGGALVGRYGGRAGVREAALAGLAAATVAWVFTVLSIGFSSAWILWLPAAIVGALGGFLGGRWGFAKRSRN